MASQLTSDDFRYVKYADVFDVDEDGNYICPLNDKFRTKATLVKKTVTIAGQNYEVWDVAEGAKAIESLDWPWANADDP